MTIDELSMSGYCCTGSLDSARHPTSTMTRLTTMARTGCLMKVSVNGRIGSPRVQCGDRARAGNADQRGLAQLERAGRRDPLAGLEPGEDADLVADHRGGVDPPHVRANLAGSVRLEHEHVVALRALAQGAHRHEDDG